MGPLQTIGLQFSWMTLVAYGLSFVIFVRFVAILSTANREYVESTTTNIVDTVYNIAKHASETFHDVPFIQTFTGIVIQIISIRREIQTEKDQSRQLIDKILRKSKATLDGLLRVGSALNRDQLKDIEGNMKDYNDLLGKTLAALKAHTSKNRLDRIINRKSRLDNLEKYDRLINAFNTDFVADLHTQSHLLNTPQRTSLPSAASEDDKAISYSTFSRQSQTKNTPLDAPLMDGGTANTHDPAAVIPTSDQGATLSRSDVVHNSLTYNQLYPPSRLESSVTNSVLNAGGNISISQTVALLPLAASDIVYEPVLPPPSELMIGRDKEKSQILDTLLGEAPARIAILGAGGMGKTTLALSSLHDSAVIERFASRYFVSCEAVTSTTALVGEIANVLHIPPAKRDEHLTDMILSSFHDNAVLCLDNFESIWDNQAERFGVEGFLSHLNHLPQLAIIITMRGTQRPLRMSWSKPLLPPLEKLSDADSKLIFETICGPADAFVEKLLKAIDGIPLAVTLISALVQEGNETSESMWARWEKTQMSVIENGGNDRLSNLDTSIHLSVYGPRMQADPNTISILAMLSGLPDGLPYTSNESTIDDLQRHLPEDIHLREALLTMRRVALLNVDKTNTLPRFRMLPPIRRFCERRLETPEILTSGLTLFYTEMINNFRDLTDPAGHAVIPAELGNMHTVFLETCRRSSGDRAVVRACITYTKWSVYMGNPVEEVICSAMENMTGSPGLLGDCHFALSGVHFRRNKLEEAQASCEHALELHRQAHDVLREADDVKSLGDVHFRRNKLEEAQALFEHALELHRQAHSVLGEANDVQSLGEVHFRRNKLEEAQASFEHALELHRQAHSVIGEANDVQRLGDVHFRRDEVEEAQASFEHALELHRQAHDVLGEANDVQSLGDVHLRWNKLEEAQASFELALELHRQAQHVLGEADDVQSLGDVHFRQNKLEEAQASFEQAFKLHRQAHSVLGEGNDVQRLGDVHFRRDEVEEAQVSFEHALELHRQAHDVLGEANDAQSLGDVHFRRNKLEEAQASFEHALKLHRLAHSVLGEANDVQRLGDIHFRQHKLDKARASFEHALKLHRQAQYVLGEADDIQKLRDVDFQQDKLEDASTLVNF